MHVYVRGAKDRTLSKWLRTAAKFYADELMHANLVKNLTLKIIIKENDEDFSDKGRCEWDDTDGPPDPRFFTILIAKTDPVRDFFTTLAHEMVHLKQYAKNEMSGLVGPGCAHAWKGVPYKLNSKMSPKKAKGNKIKLRQDGSDYYYQPWEIEAYGLEVGLFAYFNKLHDIDKFIEKNK